MLYHIARGAQHYGPYTLEDLRRYVASGNILMSDLARSDDSTAWVPVGQVLGQAEPSSTADFVPLQSTAGAVYPPVSPYPDPPNLHWALVLVIGLFTCGLFFIVWDIVQAIWMRKVSARSNALFLYLAADAISIAGNFSRGALIAGHGLGYGVFGLGVGVGLVTFVLVELGRFDLRRTLEEHYNSAEPVGLTLGPVMTFFFGGLYFQYHLTRINELKRMSRFRSGLL